MTTQLKGTLTRAVLIGGEPYKVQLSEDGLRVTPRGRRKGVDVSWDTLLALGAEPTPPKATTSSSDVPRPIAADVAREIRDASTALARAAAVLAKTGGIPASLLAELPADRAYGRAEQRDDWFVEPLLTSEEVASILRISKSSVPHLGMARVLTTGGNRYRQSEVRAYIAKHEVERDRHF